MNPIHTIRPEAKIRQDIRRRRGNIDFDFYRAQATALRGQAIRDAARAKYGFAAILAVVAVVTVLVAAVTVRVTNTQVAATPTHAAPIR